MVTYNNTNEAFVMLDVTKQYYIAYRGALQAGKIVGIRLKSTHSNEEPVVTNVATYRFLMPDGSYQDVDTSRDSIFASESAYLNNNPVGRDYCKISTFIMQLAPNLRVVNLLTSTNSKAWSVRVSGFICVGGVITSVDDEVPSCITFKIQHNEDGTVAITNDIGYDTKVYATRNEALFFNDTKVVESDGAEHIVPSTQSLIEPDKYQQDIIARMKQAFTDAKEAGLRFYFDYNCEELYAINTKNFPDGLFYIEFGDDNAEDIIVPRNALTKVSGAPYAMNDEETLYISCKKS